MDFRCLDSARFVVLERTTVEIRRFRESFGFKPSRWVYRHIPNRRSPLPRRQSQNFLAVFGIKEIGVLDHPDHAGPGVLGRADKEPHQEKEVIMAVIRSVSATS